MAEYIVIGFAGEGTAANVLKQLSDEGQMELNFEAASLATRDKSGKLSVHATTHETSESAAAGAIAGGIAGLLIGALAANPIAGLVAGTAIGGMSGVAINDTNEIGIEDDFAAEVGKLLEPDSSAICFLFWDRPWDQAPETVTDIIHQTDGKVIRTTLSVADEAELKLKLGLS